MSQPSFAPVNANCSRTISSNVVRASTSTLRSLPLTLSEIVFFILNGVRSLFLLFPLSPCSLPFTPHRFLHFTTLSARAGTLGETVGPSRQVGSQCDAIEILPLQAEFIGKRFEEWKVTAQPPINRLGQFLIVGVRGLVAIGQHGQPLPFVHDPRDFECERQATLGRLAIQTIVPSPLLN